VTWGFAAQVGWPGHGEEAINEFTTPDWLARCFPHLFPYGDCQLGSTREITLTPKEFFKHCMRHASGRFARDLRFRYTALNAMMRWQAMELSKVYVEKALGHMSVDQIQEKVRDAAPLLTPCGGRLLLPARLADVDVR
jgi:hypothetical protein